MLAGISDKFSGVCDRSNKNTISFKTKILLKSEDLHSNKIFYFKIKLFRKEILTTDFLMCSQTIGSGKSFVAFVTANSS